MTYFLFGKVVKLLRRLKLIIYLETGKIATFNFALFNIHIISSFLRLQCSCHAIFIRFLNQVRAKVGVMVRHVNYAVVFQSKRDNVTRFQVENTGGERGTSVTFSRPGEMNQGHTFAVYMNRDPSFTTIVGLHVDIVPSSGRHSQFSILVLHAACKMAVRGAD